MIISGLEINLPVEVYVQVKLQLPAGKSTTDYGGSLGAETTMEVIDGNTHI